MRFGNASGEWESELKEDEYITEIVVAGAKSYYYVTNEGKTVVKQKGITLDRANSNNLTFEQVKHMTLDNGVIKSEEIYQFMCNNSTKYVETRYISRSAKPTLDSKRELVVGTYDTVPFGNKQVL